MFTERASVLAKCPECGNDILIDQVWYPGGANDYGSFEVECLKCKHHFDIYVGRDIDASSIKSGAKLIKSFINKGFLAALRVEIYGKNLMSGRDLCAVGEIANYCRVKYPSVGFVLILNDKAICLVKL